MSCNEAYQNILNIAENPERESKKFMDELIIRNFFGNAWDNHYTEFLKIDFDKPVVLREIKSEKKRIVLHYGENELGRIYYRKQFDSNSIVLAAIQSEDKQYWDLVSILESSRPVEIYSSSTQGRSGKEMSQQYKSITNFLEKNCKDEIEKLHYTGDNKCFVIMSKKKKLALPNEFGKIKKTDLKNYIVKFEEAIDYTKNAIFYEDKILDDAMKHKLLIFLNLKKKECQRALNKFSLDKKIMSIFAKS